MSRDKFGTAINCIDGRVQLPVFKWLKEKYYLDFIDMITEPGPDKVLSQGRAEEIELLKSKVLISIKAHGSDIITIAGHYDCAGNPVSKEEHWNQIRKAVQVIRSWNLPVKVIGIWVNENWEIEVVDIKEVS